MRKYIQPENQQHTLKEILYALGYRLVQPLSFENSDCSLMDLNFRLKRLSETNWTDVVV